MIGRARVEDDLYHLEDYSGKFSRASFLVKPNKDPIWLHHLRLGHPSFRILQFIFPSLFKRFDVRNLRCDVCELAKHKKGFIPSY